MTEKIQEVINFFGENSLGKEAICKGLNIPPEDFQEWFMGLENTGHLYSPAKNEYRLTKAIYTGEELINGEDFLHHFTKLTYPQIKLSDLNSKHIGMNVSIDCQITGEQSQKAIKSLVKYECPGCGIILSVIQDLKDIGSLMGSPKHPTKCSCGRKGNFTEISAIYIDFSLVYVRDLLDKDKLTSVKKYESKRVYIIDKILPNVKKVKIYGRVVIEPRTQNISLICSDIDSLENQIQTFNLTEEKIRKFKEYFASKEIQEIIHKQINPDIVGVIREIDKKAIILQLHSPAKIPDIERKRIMRGGINKVSFGDTKGAKSETNKDSTNKGTFPVGEYVTCETGGRTGLLYTIDSDKGMLIWGVIPLNDMGLVVLDGLQNMSSLELGEFRETIEQQEVIVRRSQSGEALARTRISALLNPNKPMNNYLYKCQALEDTYVFAKTPDLTRFDLFIPYCKRDVSPEEISSRKSGIRPIPNDIFLEHIYWAWSRKPEQITYTNSAIEKIQELSMKLIKDYSLESLPIVHNGAREILTRFSVAMACQMDSTDSSHEEVIVETAHVQKAYNFYVETLDLLELSKYKSDLEGRSELSDGDIVAITKELSDLDWKILSEIKVEPKSSTQLADQFNVSSRTIKEHYITLRNFGLIETKIGSGASLSVRGVKFVRWGLQNHSAIGKKNFPNQSNREEKPHPFTKKIYPPSSNFNEDEGLEALK